jgi:hypothetical protein
LCHPFAYILAPFFCHKKKNPLSSHMYEKKGGSSTIFNFMDMHSYKTRAGGRIFA